MRKTNPAKNRRKIEKLCTLLEMPFSGALKRKSKLVYRNSVRVRNKFVTELVLILHLDSNSLLVMIRALIGCAIVWSCQIFR